MAKARVSARVKDARALAAAARARAASPAGARHAVEVRETAVALYAASGELQATADAVGVDRMTVLRWLGQHPTAVEEARRVVASRAEAAIAAARDLATARLVERLEDPDEKTSPRDLAVIMGIATDKVAQLQAEKRDADILPGDAVGAGALALARTLREQAAKLERAARLAPLEAEAQLWPQDSEASPAEPGAAEQSEGAERPEEKLCEEAEQAWGSESLSPLASSPAPEGLASPLAGHAGETVPFGALSPKSGLSVPLGASGPKSGSALEQLPTEAAAAPLGGGTEAEASFPLPTASSEEEGWESPEGWKERS